MGIVKDMTGMRFGRLSVTSLSGIDSNGRAMWNCTCNCGKNKVIRGTDIRSGRIVSCGCWKDEQAGNRLRTHGKGHSRLNNVWYGMKERCYNPNATNYCGYGDLGVKVCNEWKDNFQAFYEWAMANGYDENAKRGECNLDRIDAFGNYEPSNCRWVSMKVQGNNRRMHATHTTNPGVTG